MSEAGTPTPSALPAALAAALAGRQARLAGFAGTVRYYESVGSTNDVADRLAAAGAPHGTVVVAASQERGRGRMGREWFSPPGAGLYVSVVLRPSSLGFDDVAASGLQGVTLAASVTLTAGVALAEAVREVSGLPVEIKWPNDLVIGGRKLCGILAEATAGPDGLDHVVLGFGINVRHARLPGELARRATSLEDESGRPVDEHALLAEALTRLGEGLRELAGRGFDGMLGRWRRLSPSSVGAPVDVLVGDAWHRARTAGIDRDGALLVDRAGTVHRVIAGEVRWH